MGVGESGGSGGRWESVDDTCMISQSQPLILKDGKAMSCEVKGS